jgi:glycosyltransferase involved in cell wall biosynthesis
VGAVMAGEKYEIIAVDDASSDGSPAVLDLLKRKILQLRIIRFRLHKGKWAALEAGFGAARGEIIITCDSDLQDDPREVIALIAKIEAGYDLVSGRRKNRKDLLYKVWISKLGNRLVSLVYGYRFHDLNSPYKIYKRHVLESIPKHGSLLRFSMLFAKNLGYKVCEVPVNHRARLYGKSKFGVIKYGRILFDLVLVILLFSGSGRVRK